MRPPEVFVRELTPAEGQRLKRLSKQSKLASTLARGRAEERPPTDGPARLPRRVARTRSRAGLCLACVRVRARER
jgi:hypothetical protein